MPNMMPMYNPYMPPPVNYMQPGGYYPNYEPMSNWGQMQNNLDTRNSPQFYPQPPLQNNQQNDRQFRQNFTSNRQNSPNQQTYGTQRNFNRNNGNKNSNYKQRYNTKNNFAKKSGN